MKKNLIRIVVFMAVCAMLFSTFASAAEAALQSSDCALMIEFVYGGVPVADARFLLYRAGEMTGGNHLRLCGDFADYPVVVDGLNNERFQKAADTLAAYAAADGLVPMAELKTDESGYAEARGLEQGLYLLVGEPVKTADGTYLIGNQLIILPYVDNATGNRQCELTIKPKVEFDPAAPSALDLQVVKVWDDKANGGYYRPASVTVHLLQDGKKYDTVTLNEANSWRHEWTGLDHSCAWSVMEEVPEGYTVTLSLEGSCFIITNTGKTPPPPTPTPPPIPQTGQLWWPVPVLGLLGVTLLAMGLLWRKDDEA